MPVNFAYYSGKSNTGFRQTKNEDYIAFHELGDDLLFALIADGSGSGEGAMFQPASIVVNKVGTIIKRIYNKQKGLLLKYPKFFLEETILEANDALIAFKLGDEIRNMGFATTITCALIEGNGRMTLAHVGNTRLYVLRKGKLIQLTKDHTLGQELVEKKAITEAEYYVAAERLTLTNGLGVSAEPFVQVNQVQLRMNDIVLMSSDGLHYSIKDIGMIDTLLASDTPDDATEALIQLAIDQKNFSDNISVNVIWFLGKPERGDANG